MGISRLKNGYWLVAMYCRSGTSDGGFHLAVKQFFLKSLTKVTANTTFKMAS